MRVSAREESFAARRCEQRSRRSRTSAQISSSEAAYAGLAGSEKFGTNDEVVSSLFTRGGGSLVVLAASKGRQLSLEDPAFGGSLFASAIVEVLTKNRALYDTDHSGLVDLSELYRGVKQIVMQKSQNEQTPWLARNGIVGDLSLF
jgi:hypothetical protein